MGELAGFLPILAILVIFYLLLIRPQSKRAKQQREMQAALSVGSEVMLTSGIHGTLVAVDDPERVEVRVAEGVVLTVARAAIATVAAPGGPDQEAVDDTPEVEASETEADRGSDDTRRDS